MKNTINLDRKICPGCGTENPESLFGEYFHCAKCDWCDQWQLKTVRQMMNGGYLDCDRVNLTEFLRTLLGVTDEILLYPH